MTLPKQSPKRLAAIADGSWKPKPRKPLNRVKAGTPQAARMVKRAFGKTPKSDRAKWMKEADKWFSEFIRLRDADENGRAKCVTCSHWDRWRGFDCGHCVERGNMSVRYDERNCNIQCKGCNWNGGQRIKHEAFIDMKYGAGTVAILEQKERIWRATRSQMKAQDFRLRAEAYRAKVELIKAMEPGKYHRA